MLPAAISQLRSWDVATAQNVDRFLAISRTVAARIRKYYRRDATVIYPPVNCDAFTLTSGRAEDYYLIVSRLIPYKRIDLAVDAFSRLGIRLKIVGSGGRDLAALRARAGRNVEFVGRVSDGFRQLQTGFARSYALSMLAGAALVVAAILAVRLW